VRLDAGSRFVWWGEDADDETLDAVAIQESQVLSFQSARQAVDFARDQGWHEAPDEPLAVVDVPAAKQSVRLASRFEAYNAWLTAINFADDIEHSVAASRPRYGQALAVYQRLVEATIPYLTSDLDGPRTRWSKHDLDRVSTMVDGQFELSKRASATRCSLCIPGDPFLGGQTRHTAVIQA